MLERKDSIGVNPATHQAFFRKKLAVPMRLRNLVPVEYRRHVRAIQRKLRDYLNGHHGRFAQLSKAPAQVQAAQYQILVKQAFLPSNSLENKIHNIRMAGANIHGICLKPGNIFSFFNCVGNPSQKKGYKEGRNIVNGNLQMQVGGGLCQLSAILYHTALKAGMSILERHAHSYDLYWGKDHERYTPIGLDATVAYGYKDFRFQNPYDFDLNIWLYVEQEGLTCCFCTDRPLEEPNLHFEVVDFGEKHQVELFDVRKTNKIRLATSLYRRMIE
jgi:vancomycin resistance protein VanW